MAEEAKEEKMAPEREEFIQVIAKANVEAEALASAGKLTDALELLLGVEKKTRLAGDAHSTADVAVAIVQLIWKQKDLAALNAHVLILSKRRSQLKHAVTKMVQECVPLVDEIADRDARVALVETLRTVTDGKIYVEVERARLTRTLALLYESEGKVNEASDTLQEIAVETFTGMDTKERADFLLEQVRLCLAQRDFIRMHITSNKVSKKVLDQEGFEELKMRFYHLLIELHSHKKDPKALCRDWQAIYNTTGVKDDRAKWVPALQSMVVYLAVTPFDHEVSDLRHRILMDANLDELPVYKRVLTNLTTDEIIPWPSPDAAELQAHPVLAQAQWYTGLRETTIQHNIRVIAKYYSRIRFTRVCQLLSLEPKEAEKFISDMVSEKALHAKIDRPAGVVRFHAQKSPADVLTSWSGDVSTLLGLVEETCHLINKENMVHGVKA